MALQIPTITIDDLRAFGAHHFPHASTPDSENSGAPWYKNENHEEEDDGLGYYSDGTKRTLTDAEIAFFRHSEIRSILRRRRFQKEAAEFNDEGEATPPAETRTMTAFASSTTATNYALGAEAPHTDQSLTPRPVQGGRGQSEGQQTWAKSSVRTKARNKRHRQNHRAKKKQDKRRAQQMEQEQDDESDEWDPWHQANGPDVQKEETVVLDY